MVLHTSTSTHLTKLQAIKIIEVAVNAYCMNRPFNQFLTIHLQRAGVARPHLFVSKFLKYISDWHRRHFSEAFCYLWVLENPSISDDGLGGLHIHILLHIPTSFFFRYRRSLSKWISLSGGTMKRGVLNNNEISNSGPSDDVELYLQGDLLRLARYFQKGVCASASKGLGIEAKPQGVVTGRRFGYSQSLRSSRDTSRRTFVRRVSPELMGSNIRGFNK
jgi:hypothetical protein